MVLRHNPEPEVKWRMLPEGEARVIADIGDALIIREKGLFLLTDTEGHVAPGNGSGFGLYHEDTRYLSGWELTLVGVEPVVLVSSAEEAFWMEQVMTNPELIGGDGEVLPGGSLQIRRQRVLDRSMIETTRFTNYSAKEFAATVQISFAADFDDIFEVRGLHRSRKGASLEYQMHPAGLLFRYWGADSRRRQTRIRFQPEPDEVQPHVAQFHLVIPPRSSCEISAEVIIDETPGKRSVQRSIDNVRASHRRWKETSTHAVTSNELFNAALGRAFSDLRVLWSDHGGSRYLSAGVPWYDTLFGRDSLLSSYMTLPYRPDIARHVLKTLAESQGTAVDLLREEEPGKIIHERRDCESAATGEVVFSRYYGSVDATPLFVLLAGEYYRWTADLGFLRRLGPNIEAALAWIDGFGDKDGDRLVEYIKMNEKGLDNQGWKDSWDGIVDGQGDLVAPPVALVEVQGYIYAAKIAIAEVFEDLGEADRAKSLRKEAAKLRATIEERFWHRSLYGMALNGVSELPPAVASNAGHLLWSGVPSRQRGKKQVERLMRSDMFSGWGIRTLTSNSSRFNPIGYHTGTVWPHDNALILAGFKRYGAEDALNTAAQGLFEAALTFPYFRLPELLGGSPRRQHQAPVPYPVACRPHAFAAAALPSILWSILGLVPDAPNGRLHLVRPHLPNWLNTVELSRLRVGGSSIDLTFHRSGGQTEVEVVDSDGIDVVQTDRWPDLTAA